MTTPKPDLLSLATRFALLPDAQRKAFLTKLDAAGIDFRVLPIPPRGASGPLACRLRSRKRVCGCMRA